MPSKNRFKELIKTYTDLNTIIATDIQSKYVAKIILETMEDILIPFVEEDKNLDWYYDKIKSKFNLDISHNTKYTIHQILWETYLHMLWDMELITCECRWLFPNNITWTEQDKNDLIEIINEGSGI